ncbi:MAG: TPR end-of-group domain-containing protein [Planctomycetota bacterium]|jgi:hypothetical protein
MRRYSLVPLALLLLGSVASAGGGPETTLVAVNGRSPASRLVANEYAAMRDIPPNHLVVIEGVPHLGVVTLDVFLERIWKPIEAHMKREGIEDQIDLITYSVDFPYGVNFRSVLSVKKPGLDIGGTASLTGVTYLVRHVVAGKPFWDLQINRYYRVLIPGGSPPRDPTTEEQKLHAEAQKAIQRQDWAGAAMAYEDFLATFSYAAGPWYNLACCQARLGEPEKALESLERAVEKGYRDAGHAGRDPDLASIRERPEFKALCARMRDIKLTTHPGHGFRSTYAWTGGPEPAPPGKDSLHRYYLSTRLGYTGFKGNSVPEILACLRAAVSADGTRPDGTVYVCKNGNVRSTARQPFVPLLVERLTKLKRKVAVLEKGKDGQTGVIPIHKDDVIGAVVGTANFSWGKSKSRILPGAICEHLTSHGANFGTPGQTKISEFFRFGAAGSSGTVMEPMSYHHKFPNPLIHAYYAEGCSLAEAFFQSVWGPFQLMVAGDGLARPFAELREVEVKAPKSPWKGRVRIEPKGADARYELWVDGRRVAEGGALVLDTETLEDGHHDVRVVAIASDRVETRSYTTLEAVVMNSLTGKKTFTRDTRVSLGEPISVRASGGRGLEVLHAGRVVASAKKSRCVVPSEAVGPGKVVLIPRVLFNKGKAWRGAPIAVEVLPPKPIKSRVKDRKKKPGLLAKVALAKGEKEVVVPRLGDKRSGKRLRELPAVKGAKRIDLAGEISAPEEGFYQLVIVGSGKLDVSIAGKSILTDAELGPEPLFVPVSLAEGWHPVRIVLTPKGAPHLEIMLSGQVAYSAPDLRH